MFQFTSDKENDLILGRLGLVCFETSLAMMRDCDARSHYYLLICFYCECF